MLAMLVNDCQRSLFDLKRILKASDEGARSFKDADLALEAACHDRFDLVIVDHVTPKIDGITFIRRLRGMASYAQVPIVMMTADTSRPVRLQALDAGATLVLPKTSDWNELRVNLRNLIALSSAVRQRDDHAASLAREIEVASRKLHEREEEMIFRLSLAVEYRDNDTGEHTLRVARYSKMIAEELGLSPDECRSIYLAAPLHDVGKVAVPDQVLLKPGRLTEQETVVVRTHAAVGERILGDSSSDLMRLAAEIAGHHHERWDGQGYPRRIAGPAIPLSARIVAVADVFDAMTTERPYKAAMPVSQALDTIAVERGQHFDPQCVDAFIAGYTRLDLSARAARVAAEASAPVSEAEVSLLPKGQYWPVKASTFQNASTV